MTEARVKKIGRKPSREPPRRQPLKRQADVAGRVYDAIHHKAIHFHLLPGQHVNELALAKELNVSRTPIREALNRLASESLMSFVPNKGFYTRSIDIDSIHSLFEVRNGLETMAVRLACERAPIEAIDALATYWRGIKAISKKLTVPEIVQHDEAFHERLVELARNPELTRLVKETNARIHFMRVVAMDSRFYRQITFEDHLAIIEALRRRDTTECLRRVEKHIAFTRNDIEKIAKETIARIYLRKPDGHAA